ncbi:MAG: hypothetical protein Q4F45_07735 [Alistipes sp.]|nr:hypothetical protein [Alistipes sp.]
MKKTLSIIILLSTFVVMSSCTVEQQTRSKMDDFYHSQLNTLDSELATLEAEEELYEFLLSLEPYELEHILQQLDYIESDVKHSYQDDFKDTKRDIVTAKKSVHRLKSKFAKRCAEYFSDDTFDDEAIDELLDEMDDEDFDDYGWDEEEITSAAVGFGADLLRIYADFIEDAVD